MVLETIPRLLYSYKGKKLIEFTSSSFSPAPPLSTLDLTTVPTNRDPAASGPTTILNNPGVSICLARKYPGVKEVCHMFNSGTAGEKRVFIIREDVS
jgi:hypothetical protein